MKSRSQFPWSLRHVLAVVVLALLASLMHAENRMLMMLYLWLPCKRWMPSAQGKLLILVEKYLHLERAWNPSTFEAVPFPEITAEEFTGLDHLQELSQGGRTPVIIRGLMNSSKARAQAGKQEWIQKYTDFKVNAVYMPTGLHYNLSETVVKTLSFPEYIEELRQGKGVYAWGFDEMLVRYPEIYASLGLESLQARCRSLSLQVNGGGQGLKLHMANHPNLVTTYHGTKIWELIHYRFSVFLGAERPGGAASFGYMTTLHPVVEAMYQFLPKTKVTLQPGDVFFNPPWHWHQVNNTADPETGLVVMSTCRWSDVGMAVRTSPALELYKSLGWEAYIHPSLPLWLRWVPFFRVFQDGFREYFNLIPSFGEPGYTEDCFSSKATGCDKVLKRTGHGTKEE